MKNYDKFLEFSSEELRETVHSHPGIKESEMEIELYRGVDGLLHGAVGYGYPPHGNPDKPEELTFGEIFVSPDPLVCDCWPLGLVFGENHERQLNRLASNYAMVKRAEEMIETNKGKTVWSLEELLELRFALSCYHRAKFYEEDLLVGVFGHEVSKEGTLQQLTEQYQQALATPEVRTEIASKALKAALATDISLFDEATQKVVEENERRLQEVLKEQVLMAAYPSNPEHSLFGFISDGQRTTGSIIANRKDAVNPLVILASDAFMGYNGDPKVGSKDIKVVKIIPWGVGKFLDQQGMVVELLRPVATDQAVIELTEGLYDPFNHENPCHELEAAHQAALLV